MAALHHFTTNFTPLQKNYKMMIEYNKDRKDMQVDKMFEDFLEDCEKKAAELEITVDYYIAEFV